MDETACACRNVIYLADHAPDGSLRERWLCRDCDGEFVRASKDETENEVELVAYGDYRRLVKERDEARAQLASSIQLREASAQLAERDAQCAAMREALEYAQSDLRRISLDHSELPRPEAFDVIDAALSNGAGKSLLDELEKLRAVAEAGIQVRGKMEYPPPNSGCSGYMWFPSSVWGQFCEALDALEEKRHER